MQKHRLKLIREEIKLTQSQLGELLSVKWSKIKDVETGHIKNIPPEWAFILNRKFNISIEYVLLGEGEMFNNDAYFKTLLKDKFNLDERELDFVYFKLLSNKDNIETLIKFIKNINS